MLTTQINIVQSNNLGMYGGALLLPPPIRFHGVYSCPGYVYRDGFLHNSLDERWAARKTLA